MPGRNGTGPMKMGPVTGWRRGYCRIGAYPVRGITGFGYGWTRGYCLSPEEGKILLKNERDYLVARLKEIDEILDNSKEE